MLNKCLNSFDSRRRWHGRGASTSRTPHDTAPPPSVRRCYTLARHPSVRQTRCGRAPPATVTHGNTAAAAPREIRRRNRWGNSEGRKHRRPRRNRWIPGRALTIWRCRRVCRGRRPAPSRLRSSRSTPGSISRRHCDSGGSALRFSADFGIVETI